MQTNKRQERDSQCRFFNAWTQNHGHFWPVRRNESYCAEQSWHSSRTDKVQDSSKPVVKGFLQLSQSQSSSSYLKEYPVECQLNPNERHIPKVDQLLATLSLYFASVQLQNEVRCIFFQFLRSGRLLFLRANE